MLPLLFIAGIAWPVVGFSSPASASSCGVVSGTRGAESITLGSGCTHYFYVASTSGGYPGDTKDEIKDANWTPDLLVFGQWSGEEAISVGHSTDKHGSYNSPVGNHAIAGAGVNGYKLYATFTAQATELGPGCSGCGTTPAPGESLHLSFTTSGNDLVLILVGGQGTGSLSLSGITATTLQDRTYSEAGSAVYASAAAYSAKLSTGTYAAKFTSTSSDNCSSNGLGAVAYVFAR